MEIKQLHLQEQEIACSGSPVLSLWKDIVGYPHAYAQHEGQQLCIVRALETMAQVGCIRPPTT